MKKYLCLIILVLTLLTTLSAQRTMTLDQAIRFAQQNHMDVQIAQLDIDDAQLQIEENRAFGIPKVNFYANLERRLRLPVSLLPARFIDPDAGDDEFAKIAFGQNVDLSGTLDIQTMIFDFSYFVGLRASRMFREVTKEEKLSAENKVKHSVIEAYLPLVVIQENRKILIKNLENVSGLLNEMTELYKAGFVEELEVDRLKLSLANIETTKNNLDRQEQQAYDYLKFIMGFPVNENFEIVETLDELFVPANGDDLDGSFNYNSRKDYFALDMRRQLNELNEQYNKSRYYPFFSAYGVLNVNGQGNRLFDNLIWTDASFIGLKATVPIFDGFEKRSKLARAKINTEKIQIAKNQLKNAIDLEISTARNTYLSAQALVENGEKNLMLAQKIYDTSKIKYREGVGSSVELSQAEQALYSSQQNLIQAKYELLRAKAMLDKAYGK